jgi:hypothetical protein
LSLQIHHPSLALLVAALAWPGVSLTDATSVSLPALPGLTTPDLRWRIEGIELDPDIAAAASIAFSPDGRYVGVSSPSSIRVLDTASGRVIESLRAEAPQRLSYSLAIANTGRVSVGHPGSRQVHDVDATLPIVIFPCHSSDCRPVSLAFSPDDTVLADHEISPRPALPTTLGSVVIVDLVFGQTTRMNASAGLVRTAFAAAPPSRSPAPEAQVDEAAFELWRSTDERLPRSMLGRGWTVGTVRGDSSEGSGMVAVFGSGSTLVMRTFETDRLVWAAPLVPPALAPAGSDARLSEAAHVELSPDGRFAVTYERPLTTDREAAQFGAIVVRGTFSGAIVASYDVAGVADVAISPDSRSLVYTTATGVPVTALVSVPSF